MAHRRVPAVVRNMRRPSEAEFLRQFVRFVRLFGWLVAHFRPGLDRRGRWRTAVQGDGAGFPDTVLVHPTRRKVMVAELKVGRNKPTPEQAAWLTAFEAAGVPAYVWGPTDWDEIQRVLTGE